MPAPFKAWATTCPQSQTIFSKVQHVGSPVLKMTVIPLLTSLFTVDRPLAQTGSSFV